MAKANFHTIFIILLAFLPDQSFCQTYNKIISDQEYYAFINYDISHDSFKIAHHVFRERIPLNPKLLFYKDSADYLKKNASSYGPNFIFHHHMYGRKVYSNNLDTIFTREDIDFFGKQLKAMKKTKSWKTTFVNSILIDSVEYDYNGKGFLGREMKFGVEGYSLPLFSNNRNYVLIIKSNSVSFKYYIYKRIQNNNWQFVKTFNESALDYF